MLILMETKERKNQICHFCGATVSVKYFYKKSENDEIKLPCCNKCALSLIGNKPKKEKDYYVELDKFIREWEENVPYKSHDTFWIVERISWCNNFKKISEEQTNEFCERMINIYKKIN